MIIEFILSLLLLSCTSIICSYTSGGFIIQLIEPVLLPGLLLILALMIFLSGYAKAFVRIFLPAKKIKNLELSELKKTETSITFAFNTLIFISCFFTLISGIYFYLNFDDIQTLGPNLATVICSVFYLSFFGMILITLKGKIKRNIISFMAEETEVENTTSLTKKQAALRLVKILITLALIVSLYLLIIFASTVNNSEREPLSFYYLRDLPGIIYIFLPTFLLLAISGNFKNFFRAVSFVIKNQRLSVSQKALSLNAITTLRAIMLLEGVMTTLNSFMGILCNLEDRTALGNNFTVACVPLIYALLINIILLPVESKISLLCDSE